MQDVAQQSRQQRRFIERIEQEANMTFAALADKFLAYFSTCDNPLGQETKDKMTQINGQWRTYCTHRRLNIKAFSMATEYMDSLLKEFEKNALGKENDNQQDQAPLDRAE